MKCSLCFLVLLGALLASNSYLSVSHAAEVPSETFSIGKVTLGVTTLTQIQEVFGRAPVSRVSRQDEADIQICYVYSSQKETLYLVFESATMGGLDQISGFTISRRRPVGNCVPTSVDVGTLPTGNGVRLGQSYLAFKQAIPVDFRRRGSELYYEAVTQRMATPEELKRLRARWPDEEQHYFDVTTTLRAKFKNNQLIDFYVRKIESY